MQTSTRSWIVMPRLYVIPTCISKITLWNARVGVIPPPAVFYNILFHFLRFFLFFYMLLSLPLPSSSPLSPVSYHQLPNPFYYLHVFYHHRQLILSLEHDSLSYFIMAVRRRMIFFHKILQENSCYVQNDVINVEIIYPWRRRLWYDIYTIHTYMQVCTFMSEINFITCKICKT